MAADKSTRSPRLKRTAFSQVKGKIVEAVEMASTDSGYAIGIMFQDRTYLCFDVEPVLTVTTELSDWKTENHKTLKRWPTVRS